MNKETKDKIIKIIYDVQFCTCGKDGGHVFDKLQKVVDMLKEEQDA